MNPDEVLLDFVNRAINAGYKQIAIPQSLLLAASQEAVETVRQMCALCGVQLGVVPG